MNLSNALNFPFSNNNLVKILPIAIIYSIILFLFTFFAVSGNFLLMCGSWIAVLVFSSVIAGYYLSVLDRLQVNDEYLPDVDVGKDLKQGCMASLASFLYMVVPMIGFYILIIIGLVIAAPRSFDSGSPFGGGVGLLLIFAIALIIVIAMTVLSWALAIGFNRYVYEGRGLFALTENFGTAWSNAGLGVSLLWRQIVLGFIAFFVGIVLGILQNMMFPQRYSAFFQPTTFYWIIFALSNVITYTVSLIFGLSQIHLISQYGALLGFTQDEEKRKNVEDSGGSSVAVIIAIVAVAFFCVLPFFIIMILTILGPTIGNVFSDVIQNLATP